MSTVEATHAAIPATPYDWGRTRRLALLVAGAGIALFVVVAVIRSFVQEKHDTIGQLFLSYLVGFVFWFCVALGSMAMLMVHYLCQSSWGALLRRIFESSIRTLPLLVVLFVPMIGSLFLGDSSPYLWIQPGTQVIPGDTRAAEELEHRKHQFLNAPFYIGFAVAYFVVWGTMILLLLRNAARADESNDQSRRDFLTGMSGPGLIVWALTITFAVTHWVMSLDLSWASTMFPVIFGVNQLLSGYAFSVVVFLTLAERPPLSEMVRKKFKIDIGSLLLALTMVWSYTSFSQYLLMWVGNLPEEIPFLVKRTRYGWQYVGYALMLFHFAMPLVLLLFRDVKLNPKTLRGVAAGLLCICAVDIVWWIEPNYPHERHPLYYLLDVGAILGVGGVWAWWFFGQLSQGPLLPAYERAQLDAASLRAHAGHTPNGGNGHGH